MSMLQKKITWKIVSECRTQLFGIAIISIMVFHFCEDVINSGNNKLWLLSFAEFYNVFWGSIGVEIFLFLSGVGLWFSMEKNPDPISFYKKRASRLLIPYIIFGGLFWLIKDVLIGELGWIRFVKDFTLLSFWLEGNRNLWFIGFISIIYWVFPILYKFLNRDERHRLSYTLVIIGGILIFIIAIRITSPEFYQNTEIALLRIPIFILGVYTGEKIKAEQSFKLIDAIFVCFGILLKVCAIFSWYMGLSIRKLFTNRLAIAWFSVSLIVIMAYMIMKVSNKAITNRIISWCGEYSLEIYLTQVTLRTLMNIVGFPTCKLTNYFLCVIISLFLSKALNICSSRIIRCFNC